MKQRLEDLYAWLNRREFVDPDPLMCLYPYDDVRDREIVGLVAACLAYGRVAQILNSVRQVLAVMGESPWAYLEETPDREISSHFQYFVHRFAKGPQLSALLIGVKQVVEDYGSLNACFLDGVSKRDDTIAPALSAFSRKIIAASSNGFGPGHLMPCPEKGSACKRLHLYLRWMVRQDKVDPGGWQGISPAALIVPLDVHMFRIARQLGLTCRNQANLRTAMEITDGFRKWSPADPVRYDFALTRFGIRKDISGASNFAMAIGG